MANLSLPSRIGTHRDILVEQAEMLYSKLILGNIQAFFGRFVLLIIV